MLNAFFCAAHLSQMSQQTDLKRGQLIVIHTVSNSKDLLSHTETLRWANGAKTGHRETQNYQLIRSTDTDVCTSHSFNPTARVFYGNAKAKKTP